MTSNILLHRQHPSSADFVTRRQQAAPYRSHSERENKVVNPFAYFSALTGCMVENRNEDYQCFTRKMFPILNVYYGCWLAFCLSALRSIIKLCLQIHHCSSPDYLFSQDCLPLSLALLVGVQPVQCWGVGSKHGKHADRL
jgi:hypothetical protein